MFQSPCINVCSLDPNTGLCLGCKRTLEEINNWNIKKSVEKIIIIKKAKNRVILTKKT